MTHTMRHLAIAAALLAAAMHSSTADAQIGRIKQLGKDIVKDAAGVPDSPVKNTAARDIAITPERLDAVIAALATVAENALVESKAKAVEKEFEAWNSTFNKCVENAAKSASMTPEGMEASGKYTAKMSPLLERMGKLATSTDKRALEYVQDTLRVLDALQTDELCPCNRQVGGDTLKAA